MEVKQKTAMEGETVVVLGSDPFTKEQASIIANLKDKGIEVVVVDTCDNFGVQRADPMQLIENIQRDAELRLKQNELFSHKQFTCTGKHQYREVNGQWKCQCGRKTTD